MNFGNCFYCACFWLILINNVNYQSKPTKSQQTIYLFLGEEPICCPGDGEVHGHRGTGCQGGQQLAGHADGGGKKFGENKVKTGFS